MINLYLNSATSYTITDDEGREYTPEFARASWEDGCVDQYNMAFARLVQEDFSIDRVIAYYAKQKETRK